MFNINSASSIRTTKPEYPIDLTKMDNASKNFKAFSLLTSPWTPNFLLSVKGMLPKNKLGNQMYRKLFVYCGPEHKQAAQKPEAYTLRG